MIVAYRGMGCRWKFRLIDEVGNDISVGSNDIVRVVIDREGDGVLLSVDSVNGTVNGSRLYRGDNNEWTLRLDGADLNFEPGLYRLRVEYFDRADNSEWKSVDKHVFSLELWEAGDE